MDQISTTTPRHAVACAVAVLKAGITPLILGQPGIGKTDITREIAKKMGLGYFQTDGLLIKPVTLEGLPFPDWEQGIARWLPPQFLPELDDTLWCIEELSSPRRDTQAMLQTVFHERRIGFHPIPDSCKIIATGNTLDSGAVSQKIPAPLLDRIWVVELVPNAEDWLFWAAHNSIAPEIMACVRLLPESFYTFQSKTYGKYASPRGWHKASDFLQSNPSRDVLALGLGGILGRDVGMQVVGLLDVLKDMPSPDYCLAEPDLAPLPDKPAARYTIASACARLATQATFANGITYCNRLGPTFAEVFVTDATTATPALKETSAYINHVSGRASV